MNHYLTICAILTTLLLASAQKLQHRSIYRNITLQSETDSIYMVNITTWYNEETPKMNCTFNITKDIHVKHIYLYWNRCSFETSRCEFSERLKVRHELKSFMFDETKYWAPAINSITPKLNFPIMKKNIYQAIGAYMDESRALTLNPRAINYLWRIDWVLVDHSDRKAVIFSFEYELVPYIVKRRKLNSTLHADSRFESRPSV